MTNSAKACQSGDRCDARTLAETLYCVALHSGVPSNELAESLDMTRGHFLDCVNPDNAAQLQLKKVIPLTLKTKRNDVVAHLAKEVGGVFYQLPKGDADSTASVFQATSSAMVSVAELLHEVATRTRDNAICEQDDRAIRDAVHGAIQRLLVVSAVSHAHVNTSLPAPVSLLKAVSR